MTNDRSKVAIIVVVRRSSFVFGPRARICLSVECGRVGTVGASAELAIVGISGDEILRAPWPS